MLQLSPISLRAPVRGRGALRRHLPHPQAPPSTRRDWDACLSRRAAVCLRTLGPVTITTTGPAVALPWPSQARESCVLRLLACQTQPLCMREHLSMSRYARSFSADTLALACIGKVPTVVVLARSTGHPLSVSVALCFLLLAFHHLGPARRMYLWAQKHVLSRRCISNRRIGTWPSAESPSLARLNERTHARRVG